MRICRLLIVGFCGVCFSPAYSQSSVDSSVNESVSAFRNIYFQEIKGNARLYEGSKYDVNDKQSDGYPYFQADVIRQGTISYQGTRYPAQKLYYDLTKDAVIIYNYEHDDLISPDPDKIDSFFIGIHTFIRLEKRTGLPIKGFYEQLCTGDPGLYARREKKFFYGTGRQESRYVEKNDYYILVNHVFHKCGSKSEMLALFGDQADALKKFIHNHKIDFKDDFESALITCVNYYAGLKQ